MSDQANSERWDSPGASRPDQEPDVPAVGSYEVDDGVVFYDADNPLAWVEASTAVRLTELA